MEFIVFSSNWIELSGGMFKSSHPFLGVVQGISVDGSGQVQLPFSK